jgi:hypothetical protein
MIIVTASSAEFFHFLQGMVLSIREKPEGATMAVGCLDLGLTADQRGWLAHHGVQLVEPEWEFGLDDTCGAAPPFRAILARPHLPKYFPGHDIYMHMDADAWVQDWGAVELYRRGAQRGVMAVTPEIDRSFISNYGTSRSYHAFIVKVYTDLCGPEAAEKYREYPILNTGVFAIPAGSPIWAGWQARITESLQHGRNFHVEQASLNYEIFENFENYVERGLEFLPSKCNWVCHQALPKLDRTTGLLVEPFLPHGTLGILHRASDDFKQKKTGRVLTLDGEAVEMNLKYREGAYHTDLNTNEPAKLERWQDAGFEWTEKTL